MFPRPTEPKLSIMSRNPASPAIGNHRIAGEDLGEVPASPCSDMLSCHRMGLGGKDWHRPSRHPS
jgi:hypothetical protein